MELTVEHVAASGNQTLGRGKLFLGRNNFGKYLSDTSELSFSVCPLGGGSVQVNFATTDITRENFNMWLSGYSGDLFYEAANPVGPNVNYHFEDVRTIAGGMFNVKGDNWQELRFTGSAEKLNLLWPDGSKTVVSCCDDEETTDIV